MQQDAYWLLLCGADISFINARNCMFKANKVSLPCNHYLARHQLRLIPRHIPVHYLLCSNCCTGGVSGNSLHLYCSVHVLRFSRCYPRQTKPLYSVCECYQAVRMSDIYLSRANSGFGNYQHGSYDCRSSCWVQEYVFG